MNTVLNINGHVVDVEIERISAVEAIDVEGLPADLWDRGGYRATALVDGIPAGTKFYTGLLGSTYWGEAAQIPDVAREFLESWDARKYVTIDNYSGVIWWGGYANSPEQACVLAQAQSDSAAWVFTEVCKSDLASTAHGYLVYQAPDDYELEGQPDNADECDKVAAFPFAGAWTGTRIDN